jgi:hypothetical protein
MLTVLEWPDQAVRQAVDLQRYSQPALTPPKTQTIPHEKLSSKSVIGHLRGAPLQMPRVGGYGAKTPSVYDRLKFSALELTVLHHEIRLLLSQL